MALCRNSTDGAAESPKQRAFSRFRIFFLLKSALTAAAGDAARQITRVRSGKEAETEIWTENKGREGEDLKGKKRREIHTEPTE